MPIPTVEHRCQKECCTRTFVPLQVAYARTIHTFQGLSAGPVDKGRKPNDYECIVCDPDEKKWEGQNLGLLYTAVSRATTLGDESGMNSAIYFDGENFKEDRIRHLTRKKDSMQQYPNVIDRDKWVQHLKHNTKQSTMTKQQIDEILHKAHTIRVTEQRVKQQISKFTKHIAKNDRQRYDAV